MGRASSSFTQSELDRAVKALKKSGVPVGGVRKLPDGGFEVYSADVPGSDRSPFDEWKEQDRAGEA